MKMRILITLQVATLIAAPAFGQGNTPRGIGVGGVTGAVLGGVIGHQNDETAEGALIGGAVGAIAGGLLGSAQDTHQRQTWQNYRFQQQVAIQQANRAVTSADVVQMTRNGVSDAVIINQIQAHGVLQPLDVHAIVSLHQQGVREPVISAMQRAPLATATPTPVPAYHVPVVVAPRYPTIQVVRPLPAPYHPRYGHRHPHPGRWYR